MIFLKNRLISWSTL